MSKKSAPLLKGMNLEAWQISLFKLSTVSFGVILGFYFWDFFAPYISLVWVAAIVPGLYIGYLYFRK